MDFSAITNFFSPLEDICKTLFETYWGVGIIVVAFLLISLIVAAILEKRTKRLYQDHPKEQNDEEDVEDSGEQQQDV